MAFNAKMIGGKQYHARGYFKSKMEAQKFARELKARMGNDVSARLVKENNKWRVYHRIAGQPYRKGG